MSRALAYRGTTDLNAIPLQLLGVVKESCSAKKV
jgi:hypothetical protein